METTKTELRVSISSEADEIVRKLAEAREVSLAEAAETLIQVGNSRLRALGKYAKRIKKELKEAQKAKAEKAKSARKARKAKAPGAAEAAQESASV